MERGFADIALVLDLRGCIEGWRAGVCGLPNAVRALCAAQHAGTKQAYLIGSGGAQIAESFFAHPLYRRASEGLSIECVDEPSEEWTSKGALVIRSPVVLASGVLRQLGKTGQCIEVPLALPEGMSGFLAPASTSEERRAATELVLGSVGKPMLHSGIASVWLLQPLAKLLNRPLCHTPITPNQVTILGFLMGLAVLPLLWSGERNDLSVAVSVLLLANILDQIDGQLARIKFLFSSYGEKLDHHLDTVVKVLLLPTIGMGLYHSTGYEHWLYLGCVASAGQVTYSLTMAYYVWRFGEEGASSSNFRFWYKVRAPVALASAPAVPSNPNAIKARFFLRKDFVHTAFFAFGVFDLIEVPFLVTALGAVLYGLISLCQLILFHAKFQIAGGDYHGAV